MLKPTWAGAVTGVREKLLPNAAKVPRSVVVTSVADPEVLEVFEVLVVLGELDELEEEELLRPPPPEDAA